VPQSDFKDEQLAIMRYALASNGPTLAASIQTLRRLRTDFQAFAYPHRPHVPFRVPVSALGKNSQSHMIQGSD